VATVGRRPCDMVYVMDVMNYVEWTAHDESLQVQPFVPSSSSFSGVFVRRRDSAKRTLRKQLAPMR
jgi:hypothetical protein